MLQNLLKKIFYNDSTIDLNKLEEFLLLYEKNDYIYPSVLKKNFNFSTEKTYEILSKLEKGELLKIVYIVECYDCNRKVEIFEKIWKIKNVNCGECDNELIFPDNVKVAYEVVVEWKV